ncbi:MAG TPA: DUF6262 family protein [Streptosporangiaceae bacterium]|nr:DUF6262 family protein [Streptosporangiaceae bacterium]
MRADNSRHLIAAAERRSQRTRERALAALRRMDATGQPVSFDSLSRKARVSRSWLYAQPDLRAEITRLRERSQPRPRAPLAPDRQRASTASLLRRLEAAAARIRQLEDDNRQLRQALAEALGTRRATRILVPIPDHDTPGKHHGETHPAAPKHIHDWAPQQQRPQHIRAGQHRDQLDG